MATNYTAPGTGIRPQRHGVPSVTISNRMDCSLTNVDVSVTGALQLLDIPAGAFVNWVKLEVETVETDATNTVVLDVGDGDDPDGWLIDVDAETAGVVISKTITLVEAAPNTVLPAFGLNGKLYTAADTIDVTPSHDLDDLIFTISANYTKS